jgi:hypothetical protein
MPIDKDDDLRREIRAHLELEAEERTARPQKKRATRRIERLAT